MSEPTLRVRAPTPDERALAVAAEQLDPERSLARAEVTAKLVFANVAAVATAVTALGLSGTAANALARGPRALGAPLVVVLVAASLVLAVLALVPTLRRLDTDSPAALERFYLGQVRRRGLLALAATALLVPAIIAAVAIVANANAVGRALAVDAQTRRGEHVSVEADARAGGLEDGDWVRLRVDVVDGRGRTRALCHALDEPDASGIARARCLGLRPGPDARRVVLDATERRDGKLGRAKSTLAVP